MLPAVYLKKDVLFIMILAAIETFRKECAGILFGYKPTSERNYYIVTNAIAIQDVKSRTNNGVEQRNRSARKMNAIFEKAPELYPKIGEFHSHPEGKKKRKNKSLDMMRGTFHFSCNIFYIFYFTTFIYFCQVTILPLFYHRQYNAQKINSPSPLLVV